MRFATQQDVERLILFLGQAHISKENVEKIVSQFMLVENEQGDIVATIGYEKGGEDALLRSLVLSQSISPVQILTLFQTFLQSIHTRGVQSVYVIVNRKSYLPLFHMFGFQAVENNVIPKEIKELAHFKTSTHDTDSIVLNCQLLTMLSTV